MEKTRLKDLNTRGYIKATYLRIIEDKAGAGVDRRCPGISSRINDLSCMKLKSFELWLSFPTR
jgi:hypothetical protein